MHDTSPRRHRLLAFTLIELLVALFIIGVLLALLVPAVQQARSSARRTQCQNNLRQIGIAVHNYNDVHKTLPPGYITQFPADVNARERSHWAWGAMLLPSLDQGPLYQRLHPGSSSLHVSLAIPDGLAALTASIPVFVCPSDTGPEMNTFDPSLSPEPTNPAAGWYNRLVTSNGSDRIAIAKSNYVMVACSSISTTPPVDPKPYGPATGVGFQNSTVRFSDITDGTTNTLLVGERCFRFDDINVGAANALGFSSEVNTSGANAGIKTAGMCVLAIPNRGINWITDDRVNSARGFYSTHTGGAHFLLCDGAVRFLSENIEYNATTVISTALTNGAWIDSVFDRLAPRATVKGRVSSESADHLSPYALPLIYTWYFHYDDVRDRDAAPNTPSAL